MNQECQQYGFQSITEELINAVKLVIEDAFLHFPIKCLQVI